MLLESGRGSRGVGIVTFETKSDLDSLKSEIKSVYVRYSLSLLHIPLVSCRLQRSHVKLMLPLRHLPGKYVYRERFIRASRRWSDRRDRGGG